MVWLLHAYLQKSNLIFLNQKGTKLYMMSIFSEWSVFQKLQELF